jgi:hypothetical protein
MAKDTDELSALQALTWSELRAFEVLQATGCEASNSFTVRLDAPAGAKGYTLVGEPGALSVAMSSSTAVDTILTVYPMTDLGGETTPEPLFVDDDGGDGGLSAITDEELTGGQADAPRNALGHLVLSRWVGDAEADLRLTVALNGVALCPTEGAR